jgi:hypothetical protein
MRYACFNPTMVAVEDVPENVFDQLKTMVKEAHAHDELNDAGDQNISIRGGQQIQLLPNNFGMDVSVLKTFVESCCEEYLEKIIQVTGINELYKYKPVLNSAWTIKQTKGHYQALHTHEAHISGNIYIDVPDLDSDSDASDSCLEFRLPVVKNVPRFIFTDSWRVTPEVAKMVVFPSHLPHTVYPWKGKGSRTVLAWDAILVDKTLVTDI